MKSPTYMKNCNGHRKVDSASEVEPEGVSDSVKELQVVGRSADNCSWRLLLNCKSNTRHLLCELFTLFYVTDTKYFFVFFLEGTLRTFKIKKNSANERNKSAITAHHRVMA
jgi:hypothetical protein